MIFELHFCLKRDTLFIADLNLSQLLLMNDKRFPWVILVPKKAKITEIYELSEIDQQMLLSETIAMSKLLKDLTQADKLNIASLGNIVPQLHIHIIARCKDDEAWPSPVWNFQKPMPYLPLESEALIQRIRHAVSLLININF